MGFDRHIERWMAAMILAIVAYVAPFAVDAHEGHVHCGQHRRVLSEALPPPPSVAIPGRAMPLRFAEMRAPPQTAPRFRAGAGQSTASLRADHADRGCCPGACKRSCCGTMVCCTFGIVAGPASLSVPLFGAVVLLPQDVPERAGIGPEALRKPPRTLA
jgi:hypothetical protein